MPLLVTFDNRPVKRRHRVPGGLRLLFFTDRPGQPGHQIDVTDDDWARLGQIVYLPADQLRDARSLARTGTTTPRS